MNDFASLTALEWDVLTNVTVLLPTGSTEQHGPHLPMDTDSTIARAVCESAARLSPALAVAPTISYGVSDHHRDIPGGAVSAGPEAFALYVSAVGMSLIDHDRRRGVLIVNGHGGNRPAIGYALDRLGVAHGEQPIASCSWWDLVGDLAEGADTEKGTAEIGHAGAVETSVMLALDDARVRRERIPEAQPPMNSAPVVRWLDFRRFPTGVVGAPRAASTELGHRLVGAAAKRIAELASDLQREWWKADE